jgi:Protein of unknown function (DUF3073)
MGRGRQRAKQAKVARELKYFSPDTDYAALQRELAGSEGTATAAGAEGVEEDLDESVDDDYGWTAERR